MLESDIMPELPEVETTVLGLRSRVVGLTIRNFWCDHARMIRYISPTNLGKQIKNKKIVGVHRRAKNILIDLSGGLTLVIHMKMTGHLLYGKWQMLNGKWNPIEPEAMNDPYNRFIHVVFTLDNGKSLAFSDMRKFGKIAIHDTSNLHTAKELIDLGPELWEIDSKKFVGVVGRKKSRIKQVLLDQKVLAGVGNIYSDEGLWAASIHPLSQPNKIPSDKLLKLFKALVDVTKRSLKTGGDSMSDYRNIDGMSGWFQNFHKAYRQTGEVCKQNGCRGKIERIMVGARSAHFCNKHQKLYAA